MAGEGAGPGQSEHRPSGQTAKLLGIHRQVRRHDDDDGAVSFPFRRRPPELTSHRYAEQMKILPFSEVGKDQHADMIPITADRDAPGGGADSPFPAETDHARPGTDTPLLYRTGLGPPESLPGMFGADMEPTHIVQVAVVALRHHHIDRSRLFPDAAIPFHQILQRPLCHRRDRKGVGEQYGGFNGAQLLHLDQAGGFPVSVDDVHRRRHLFAEEVSRMGKDRRHAGPNPFPLPEGAVAHRNPLHIGDRVNLSRRENPHKQPVFPQPFPRHSRHLPVSDLSLLRLYRIGPDRTITRRE